MNFGLLPFKKSHKKSKNLQKISFGTRKRKIWLLGLLNCQKFSPPAMKIKSYYSIRETVLTTCEVDLRGKLFTLHLHISKILVYGARTDPCVGLDMGF